MKNQDPRLVLPMIPPHRIEMHLRIINDHQNHQPITLRLCYLEEHFPPNLLDKALRWLIENNLIGSKFVMWFDQQCIDATGKVSDLQMLANLLRVVENSPVDKIIAGKNFKL